MSYNKIMRKIIVLIVLLVPSLAYAQPSIKFYEESHDFGRVLEGAKVEHIFEFTNEGEEDLVIEKVAPS